MYSNNNMISIISKIIGNIYTDYPITKAEIQPLFNLIQEKLIERELIVLVDKPVGNPSYWIREARDNYGKQKYEVDEEGNNIKMYESVLPYLTLNEIEDILNEWSKEIKRELQPSQLKIGAIAIQRIGDKQLDNLDLLDMLEVMGEYGKELTHDDSIAAAKAAAKAAAEAERKRERNTIIGASVGGVVFLVIIIIVIMKTSNKKRSKRQVKNKKRK